jgi:hypothetical protein
VHYQGEPTRLPDRREILDDVLVQKTKAEPMMRRHDVEPGGASRLGPTRLFNCIVNAFADDRGDYWTNILRRVRGIGVLTPNYAIVALS